MGLLASGVESAKDLSQIVTADMMNGVLSEVISLLPVCIPTLVGFIALRKGIAFIQSILRSA